MKTKKSKLNCRNLFPCMEFFQDLLRGIFLNWYYFWSLCGKRVLKNENEMNQAGK